MMQLTGDIPGLLRRCSPVYHTADPGRSMVVDYLDGEHAWVGHWERLSALRLDRSDPTGRFHARLWLADRGHDVGNEDRAEVLAWSVLSVWRGGRALPVAGAWDGSGERWVEGRWTVAHVTHTGWWVGGESGHETGNVAKTAADAALLRLGWALTNPDGTLTLPPLPGAK